MKSGLIAQKTVRACFELPSSSTSWVRLDFSSPARLHSSTVAVPAHACAGRAPDPVRVRHRGGWWQAAGGTAAQHLRPQTRSRRARTGHSGRRAFGMRAAAGVRAALRGGEAAAARDRKFAAQDRGAGGAVRADEQGPAGQDASPGVQDGVAEYGGRDLRVAGPGGQRARVEDAAGGGGAAEGAERGAAGRVQVGGLRGELEATALAAGGGDGPVGG
jgi:hypothetical protein